MKKNTVVPSALALALLSISTAYSNDTPPSLSMGGFARFQSIFANNSSTPSAPGANDAARKNAALGYGFGQAGEMSFNVAGETNGGTEYSYLLTVDADGGQLNSSNPAISENRLQFSDTWGTVQLGNTDGVNGYLSVGSQNVLGGTGGPDGDFKKGFVLPTGAYVGTLMVGDSGNGTKASYFTPRMTGFQGGISFTPHTSARGQKANDSNYLSDVRSTGNTELALNYAHAWNTVGLSLSVANVTGRGRAPAGQAKVRNVNSWKTGALLTIGQWMFGANYIDNGKSLVRADLAAQGANAGKAYTSAVGYNFGAYKVALGYENSQTKVANGVPKVKVDIISLTTDYTVAPGLGVYAELDYARMKTNSTAIAQMNAVTAGSGINSNNGTTAIAGVKISF